MSDADTLKEAHEVFTECQAREAENHRNYEHDVRFSRLEEQWPQTGSIALDVSGQPFPDTFGDDAKLTINLLAPAIRQIVNDARQNRPAIQVRPADSAADPETAEIMSGLIRNIESSSDADVCYDTAVDCAASGGFGYWRINLSYACDDNWDKDIVFERIIDPLSVHGDPHSTQADSSDWNVAFVTDQITRKEFERKYKGAVQSDWAADDYPAEWIEGENITVAEYWTRSEVKKQILLLSDGRTMRLEDFEEQAEQLYTQQIVPVGMPRDVMSYEVKQRILTGVEIVEKVDWVGKFIPIVPVYGDEVVLKGKRHFRSAIRSAIDSNRMVNYWASKATAVVALAPRAPFVGKKGAFDSDDNWQRVNESSIPYLEYDGQDPPQRQPFAGVPAGMMQEMMVAIDHIRMVTGIHEASLGEQSNETSGVAIRNRVRQGDMSTFHFQDNESRAIRHGGRILVDLIPKIYPPDRVIRILGEDGKEQNIPLGQPVPVMENGQPKTDENGQPITRIYDLTAGKYDLVVKAGPSFGTQREEARAEIVEVIRNAPETAPILGPMYLRNSDWPGADEAADKLEKMVGGGEQPQIPPELQQQMEEGAQRLQQLEAENAALKQDQAGKQAEMQMKQQESATDAQLRQLELQIKAKELEIKEAELQVKMFTAETDRMVAMKPEPKPEPPKESLFRDAA